MTKIVLDVFGGDNAPKATVEGAVRALEKAKDLQLVLVGDKEKTLEELAAFSYDEKRVEFVDAKEVITNDDSPTEAIRVKRDSSIVRAMDYLNEHDEAAAFVSSGATGAVLTAAVLLLPRIQGINRPALAPILPTVKGGHVCLIDCGANVSPRALNLVQFAKMGSEYMKVQHGTDSPRVALLSNGTEDKKGSELGKEAFPMLKAEDGINFVGNMEARELLSGDYDVVVADGFSGNVCLKSAEGTAVGLFELIKQNIMAGGLRAKLGYLLLKPALKNVKKIMDYNDNGGALLIGLKKIVVKGHGASKAHSVCAEILQAKTLAESGLLEKIEGSFRK